MWVDLNDQVNCSQVAIFSLAKKLPLNVDHSWSCCLKVAMDELVVNFGYGSRHDLADVLINEILPIKAENVLYLIVSMNNNAHICRVCCHND
jgi:hypothetical protein